MKKMRLLLVSRRFWPLAGETETLAGDLAMQLAEMGHGVTVVSAGLVKQWPDEFQFNDIHVVRVSPAGRRLWSGPSRSRGASRWVRGLQRWLVTNVSEFDAVIAFEFVEDKFEVSRLFSTFFLPSLVRVSLQGHQVPASKLNHAIGVDSKSPGRFRVVVPSEHNVRCATKWFPKSSVQVIPDGIASVNREPDSKTRVRQVLADAHQILGLAATECLVVCTEPINFESGVFQLVRAWHRVVSARPLAKLWLIGSGDSQSAVYQRICDLDLANSVLMPGEFDEIRDVLQAADLFIMPGEMCELGVFSLNACQLGLPIVCQKNSPAARRLARQPNVFLFNDHGNTLSSAILSGLNIDKTSLECTADAIPTIEKMASDYLGILSRLSENGPPTN